MAPIASWDYLSTKYLQSKPKNSLINFTLKSHCWKQPQWSDCFFFYRVRFLGKVDIFGKPPLSNWWKKKSIFLTKLKRKHKEKQYNNMGLAKTKQLFQTSVELFFFSFFSPFSVIWTQMCYIFSSWSNARDINPAFLRKLFHVLNELFKFSYLSIGRKSYIDPPKAFVLKVPILKIVF